MKLIREDPIPTKCKITGISTWANHGQDRNLLFMSGFCLVLKFGRYNNIVCFKSEVRELIAGLTEWADQEGL